MFGRRQLALSALLLCGASLAVACGPDFPWQLLTDRVGTLRGTPANSFAYEAAHLVPSPRDKLQAIEFERDEAAVAAREEAEAAEPVGEEEQPRGSAGPGRVFPADHQSVCLSLAQLGV